MRIVLDTNQFVAALMRPPELATLVMAWASRRFTVVASQELIDEYEYVLSDPEIASRIYPELDRAYRDYLLARYVEIVTLPSPIPHICRDPDDDKVIATAIAGGVDVLVTDDPDLKTAPVRALLANQGVEVRSLKQLFEQLDSEAER